MFQRFITGDYNATTTILLAIFLDVLGLFAAFLMLPLLSIFGIFLLGAVFWGLKQAAGNAPTAFGRVMCWFFAALQICFIILIAIIMCL